MSELALRIAHRFDQFALDVDVRLPLRGVTALLGHSGAGKSTLLAALAGIFGPQTGRIALGDELLLDTTQRVCVPPEARRFGVVLQRPLLFPHRTVQANIAFAADSRREAMVVQSFASVVRLLDLKPLLARYPRHLSGGEQQRVALARALMSQPRLLLLDEPLAAIDRARRDEVLPYLERLCRDGGVPVLYVSHSVDEVARLADRVVVLDNGGVCAEGTTHEVLGGGVDAFGAQDIVNVIEGTLQSFADDEQLAVLTFAGGQVILPRQGAALGKTARCVLYARDIMLSMATPGAVSAHNVLPVVVDSVRADEGGSMRVALRCGEKTLAARITQASCQRLALTAGQSIYAVFKAEHLRAGPVGD